MASKKILVIDDDQSILKVLELTLDSFGFSVTTAGSGKEAFSKLKDDDFDLIILDYFLPGMDGTEICRELRLGDACANHRKTPVLILTGKADTAESLRLEMVNIGANDFLEKPFETPDLLEKINRLTA
jgi:two-component system, OmpR family, alkaline phosphatase synthesis response regulator PhoP